MSKLLTGKMIMEQRLNDLKDHISKELALQKQYEDKLRLTSDPREKAKCDAEIERQKKVVAEYERQYKEIIQRNSSISSSVQKENFSIKLNPIDTDSTDFSDKIQPIELQTIQYPKPNYQINIPDKETILHCNISETSHELKKQKPKGYYGPLNEFLKHQQWREADQETIKMILKITNRESEPCLRLEDFNKIPCSDINVINNLWLKYSENRFGLTVHQHIWKKQGGKVHEFSNGIFLKFVDNVGWFQNGKPLDYNKLIFGLEAPEGHLPSLRLSRDGYRNWRKNFRGFLSRTATCLSK